MLCFPSFVLSVLETAYGCAKDSQVNMHECEYIAATDSPQDTQDKQGCKHQGQSAAYILAMREWSGFNHRMERLCVGCIVS